MIKKRKFKIKFIFLLLIIFVSLFFSNGCNLIPNKNNTNPASVDNSKAIIVTIDGLSFANTLLSPVGLTNIQNDNNYLQTNLNKLINTVSIRSFTWSGNSGDTAAILASSAVGLRKFLIDNYNEAKAGNKAFIVVSHSWGTFLAYLALSLEPQIQCDLFITLSCPLGTALGLPVSPEQIVRAYTDAELSAMSFTILGTSYPNVKNFYNFWAHGDLISGTLAGKIPTAPNVHDVQVDTPGISDNRTPADCYFWHEFTTLGDEVVNVNSTDPTTFAAYTAYLLTILSFPYDISPTRNAFITKVVSLIQTTSGY